MMCLYEPINGDYPTESFCNLHGINCEGCPYNYDEKSNKENYDASENM